MKMDNKVSRILNVLAAILLLVILVILAPEGLRKPRTTPNTNYSGENQVTDDRASIEKSARLSLVDPSAYTSSRGVVVEPGSVIAMVAKQKGTPFWDEVEAGAEQAVADINKALNYEGEDMITLYFDGPGSGENVDDEINVLDEAIGRNPAAICIALIDMKSCEVQFNNAEDNGIPIIIMDSGLSSGSAMTVCATDNYKAGRELAASACADAGESGTVNLFLNDRTSRSTLDRYRGYVDEIKDNHPGVTLENTFYLSDFLEDGNLMDSEELTVDELVEILFSGDICIGSGAETLSYLQSWKPEDSETFVYGFDGGSEQLKLIEEGVINGFILQNPYGMGYASVITAARSLVSAPNASVVNTGYIWVDKETMETKDLSIYMYE